VLETHILFHGSRVNVFNTHLSIPINGLAGFAPAKLRKQSALRQEQVGVLLNAVHDVPNCIISGDFNMTPRGPLYRSLTANCEDAFGASGWGTGNSFLANFAMIRIDYIFLGPELGVRNCRVPDVRASDHRPVVADLTVLS